MLVLMFALAVFCGISGVPLQSPTDALNSRIHGGVDAPKAYAPHMAALLNGDQIVFIVCGGSIVSRRHILTAAHCITPFLEDGRLARTFHGRVGSNVWHSGGVIVHFQSHVIHPNWDEDIIKNDAGVLSLTSPLELNAEVAVIGLNFGWVGGGEKSYVTGWGRTGPRFEDNAVHLAPTPDNLQLLYVETLTPEECAKGINASHEWASLAPPLDPDLEICTFHSFGHGMCHGDSGSGLVSLETGELIAVVSWGMPCAVGAPDFHARIGGLELFISSALSGAG